MVIAFSNQKGGVGKTTTTLNLGVYLAKLGKKVLLIDIDPQANLTSGIGFTYSKNEKDLPSSKSIYEVLIQKATITEVFVGTRITNLFLVPSSISLAGAEIELVNMMNREGILKKALKEIRTLYDFIFIDCPPSLGIITVNALTAADKVIIPVQCEYYALEGLGQLVETIRLVKNNLNSNLEIGGVAMTMYDIRTKLSEQVIQEVRKFFKAKVFTSMIPRNVRLSEAPSHGKSIAEYDSSSSGAKAYEELAKEIIKRFS